MAVGSYSDRERAETLIKAVAPWTDGACDRSELENEAIAEADLHLGHDLGQIGYVVHCWLAPRGKPDDPTPLLQKLLDCGDLEIPSVGHVLRIECISDQYDRFRLLTAEGLYVTSDDRTARLVSLEERAPAPVTPVAPMAPPEAPDAPPALVAPVAPVAPPLSKPETVAQKKARRVVKAIVRDNPSIKREDARKAALKQGVHKDEFSYAARVDDRFPYGPKPQRKNSLK